MTDPTHLGRLTGVDRRVEAAAIQHVADAGYTHATLTAIARAGYLVSGLLHLIIGYLAIRIALGSGGSK